MLPFHGAAPPPLFKREAAPLARLVFYLAFAVALLFADLRYHTLEAARLGIATVLWPLQQLAALPVNAAWNAGGYLATLARLKAENDALRGAQLASAKHLLRQPQLEAENARLRALLELKQRQPVNGQAAEILYAARDVFSRRVVINKGAGLQAGQPVIDEAGVIGQVTRVFPLTSEVTLLTDKDQMIPVLVARNNLRAVLAGAGAGRLELRYLAANADVKPGDLLQTSGLDDIYLPGLPVARVVRVDPADEGSFARILCEPLAGIERNTEVLVLDKKPAPPPDEASALPRAKPAARVKRK